MVQKLLRRLDHFPASLYMEHETFAKDAAGIAYAGMYRHNSKRITYTVLQLASKRLVSLAYRGNF